ncbi:MAG: hypothetical protein FJY58_08670 [Betaproteobacteria bacterium]|nr:hypothetical protein [Betaproteobacteria bacterium]
MVKKTIAFHSNQICLLGTEVAMFDYADFCERMFNCRSLIISKKNKVRSDASSNFNQPLALKKFTERFPLYLYDESSEIESFLKKNHVDIFYAQKRGDFDGIESRKIRTVIHVVFQYFEPHGDVYAYISKWLSDVMTGGRSPFVPYMINLPRADGDLRFQLGIPRDAIVFGRYGGMDSFDLGFVHKLIEKFVVDFKNVFFLFMNTKNFLNHSEGFIRKLRTKMSPKQHPQIKFLPPTSLAIEKSRFINTCDAMIHARSRGETFGAAIGEFSVHNRPVITYGGNGSDRFEANHIDILGSKCFIYNSSDELRDIIMAFIKNKNNIQQKIWDAYSELFGPQPVMRKFKSVFLD